MLNDLLGRVLVSKADPKNNGKTIETEEFKIPALLSRVTYFLVGFLLLRKTTLLKDTLRRPARRVEGSATYTPG